MEKKNRKKKLSAFILAVILTLCSTNLFVGSTPEASASQRTLFAAVTRATTPSALSVSTESASYNNGYLYADGYVSSALSVTRRGFVYSRNNSAPSLSSGSVHNVGSGTGSYSGSFYVDDDNEYYYVRAYATDSNNTTEYGGTIRVNTDGSGSGYGRPTVSTVSVSDVYDRGADVTIRVSESGDSRITDRGVVYSSTYSTPTLSNSSERSVSGTTGTTTVSLSGLSTGTTYYVRAYAVNRNGTAYGQVRTFTTSGYGSDSNVSTSEVTDIKATTATAYGYVDNVRNSTIKERGFVYSTSRSTPTTSDSKVYDTVNSLGRYDSSLTGLTAGTTYYLRAYVRTSSTTYYGDVIRFTTKSTDNSNITVIYRTLSGLNVGSQVISLQTDRVVAPSLLSIPTGYVIYDNGWTHRVTGNDTVTVLVTESRPLSTATPGTARPETTFMPGAGNYEFKPDTPVTRGEAAQILYDLSNKLMGGSAVVFGDTVNNRYKTAIDYVSSNGYMVGYPDGTFRPDNSISRAEIAAILCNFYGLKGSAESNFSDLYTGYWGYNFIALATRAGMISGFEDGTYRPDQDNTRAEVCVLFSKAERRSLLPLGSIDFMDVPKTHWAYLYIMNAAVPSP